MIGQSIGSYRIVAKLGEGGMGTVWVGEHMVIGRRAAIKVLHPQYSVNAELLRRFVNEARAAAMLRHPAVVEVYDFGEQEGRAFLVMELLEGESLSARLARGPLARHRALAIVREVALALAAAHAKGIVHRDLKPDNVFLAGDGQAVKILDFGIAKLVGEEPTSAGLTAIGSVIGTPAYMSPEQCRGAGGMDSRTDVYSLGCVLYELVTGAPPFRGEGAGDVMAAQIREPARPASAFDPSVPPILDELLARMLAKPREHRPQTMLEVVAELDRAAAVCAQTYLLIPTQPAAIADARVTTLGGAAAELSRPVRRVRPRMLRLTPAVLAALVLSAAVALWPRQRTLEAPAVPIASAPLPPAPPPPIVVLPAVAALPAPPTHGIDEIPAEVVAAAVPRPPERRHRRPRAVLEDGVYDPFGER